MNLMHLTSSRFYGGPERQMLGLAQALQGQARSHFVSFKEGGHCQSFLDEVQQQGFWAKSLENDTPQLLGACSELVELIKRQSIDILVCHGYKAGCVGWWAARKCPIPAIAVSRGWTAESWKVRLYERLDRFMLRWMRKVVCVSEGQAQKVVRAGVGVERVAVIHNAISTERFNHPDRSYHAKLREFFPASVRSKIKYVVGAAGRLSPEKGYDVLIEGAKKVGKHCDNVAFVLFGEGRLDNALREQVKAAGLEDRFCMAGFSPQLDLFMPHFDLFVQSSHTEGLPNVLLESLAAGVPVVATNVGGTAELVRDNEHGRLIAPDDADLLAKQVRDLLNDEQLRSTMARAGTQWVREQFSFTRQATSYLSLFRTILAESTSNRPTELRSAASCR